MASKQRARTVLLAKNRLHPIMAGSRAQGQCSVAVWLTSSAMSICSTTNRLRPSSLVQSLPMRRTVLTFLHFWCHVLSNNFVPTTRSWGWPHPGLREGGNAFSFCLFKCLCTRASVCVHHVRLSACTRNKRAHTCMNPQWHLRN